MSVLNEHLEHQITQRLMQSEELSSQPIRVMASDRVVTLAGTVQSFRRKLKAHQIAAQCESVKSVINHLMVKPPESISDEMVAFEINQCLAKASLLRPQSVRIDSRTGAVTLTGYVSNSSELDLVADVAAGVEGVRSIKNMLVVNPDRALANDEHANVIRAATMRIIGMENDELSLSVIDESVRISGRVDALWKKDAAEKTVRQFGILNVCNEMVVVSKQP